MAKPRKTTPRTRRKAATSSDAFALATAGAELALASLRVVNARTPMIAQALNDPMRGNYAELTRMVSEKPLAFAQGAAAGGPAWLAMAAESNRYLAQVWKTPSYGVAPAMTASLGAVAFWGRMMSLGVAWQSAMLAPVHAAATANARRLDAKA
ncbi:hypothetical protein ASD21_03855 [Caulobacter sp. Root1455]|uniref:hypothetical protein n=1 Tax=Caulobacter sp. Root1455 TaxID=1736465 RepID=UPI0006FEE2AE|nr:hypothetical protein [Caulobacter sp. Root1455]KQY99102.1 hypothetical protein ASD21_03855 [Caulobacter sp. Root1455]